MALVFNLALIRWARSRLLRAMAGAAAVRLSLRESFSDAARNTTRLPQGPPLDPLLTTQP